MLEQIGFNASILPTHDARYPVVFAEQSGRSLKTLLWYNHYDVQPAEPIDLWDSNPFDPTERDGHIFARGVSDDKGHLAARIAAIKAFRDVRGELPCSVKFCIEGAEEIGSPGFSQFVEQNHNILQADACIWEGGNINWNGNPEITLGLKGILYVEMEVHSATGDSHSSYATVIPNPAWRLVWALATLKDASEHVLIPGFYDDVRPPTPEELHAVSKMPPEDKKLQQEHGVANFLKDVTGQDLRERHIFEPTCTICGIQSGYTGEGTKTVLPASAKVKVDFRLVPDMRHDDILHKLRSHLDAKGFQDVIITNSDGEYPSRTPMNSPFVRMVTATARDVYGKEPLIIPNMAGSGPMYCIAEGLKIPMASSGVGSAEDKIHAPNENISIQNFLNGILHAAAIMDEFGKMQL